MKQKTADPNCIHIAKPHKPTLKPSFAKEPPSQCTKNRHEMTRTNTSEKKGEMRTFSQLAKKASNCGTAI
ncbi:MAG: hypothetical protein U0V72_13140 [Cytophagales bacterium]